MDHIILVLYIFSIILCIYGVSSEESSPATRVISTLSLVILILIGIGVTSTADARRFDNGFQSGEIQVPARLIELGSSGHPNQTVLPINIPSQTGRLNTIPRSYQVTGCISIETPKDSTGVYAATDQEHKFTVIAQIEPGSPIIVCVDDGPARIVLWAYLSE